MLTKFSHYLRGKSFLLAGILATNVLNFVFNAYTGRTLAPTDYGFLALINTFWIILLVSSGAMTQVVSYQVARAGGEGTGGWKQYTKSKQVTFVMASLAAALWLAASPLAANYFRSSDILGIATFAPMIWLGLMFSVDRGFVQGRLHLNQIGLLFFSEALAKLTLAVTFVSLGWSHLAYLALPLSVLFAFITARLAARRLVPTPAQTTTAPAAKFPWRFFGANVLAGIATIAFLSIDLLLAKHYLAPADAGHYALLSLVGKMVFFFGSMVSMFMLTHLGDAERQGKHLRRIFWRTYGLTAGLLALGFIALGPLGKYLVPLLFGANSLPIVGELGKYSLGIALFTLASVIVTYRLSRKHYVFPVLLLAFAAEMAVHIVLQHATVAAIADAVWIAGAASFLTLTAADIWAEQGPFIKRAFTDARDLFTRRPLTPAAPGTKRILILNWRDTRHLQAGGAEIYIHEMARRWHLMGHQITLFCGSDGHSPRHEVIDGIHIIRRGGFYIVYLWAVLYYILRLRRAHDVIIDCHNGIPFFTPLYSRKPIYCVVHHVHQDVFTKYLNKPMALLASHLERTLMPRVYRRHRFMTVSNSSKHAMVERLGISASQIDIVPNGVDLARLVPGEKAEVPTVLYVGRLKPYKSVDVLINAFVAVHKRQPTAKLIIAGTGDDEPRLKDLVTKLGLTRHVSFLGRVTEDQKIRLLQEAWVFVNPSYAEGWGITTNACGTPVIASDVPGLRDSVKFPSAGYLVEYGNVKAFARKVLLVLNNEDKRLRMSDNANNWAHNFDWQTSAVNFLEVIS
jgi:glycosyltransferase involved in cell wall biosynthesis/O-antigen/teichoic acid export membrane protein